MNAVPFILFVHVLLAITAVGSNMTYGIWIARAKSDAAALGTILHGIKFIDDHVANPAYALLLVTGLLVVWLGHFSIFGTFWLETGLGLYIVVVLVGLGIYTPTLRDQIAALQSGGIESSAYKQLEVRGRITGIVLGVLVVVIVFLMVVKPTI